MVRSEILHRYRKLRGAGRRTIADIHPGLPGSFGPVARFLIPAKIGFLDAATPRYQPDSRLNQTQHRVGVHDKFVRMHQHFKTTAECQTRWRANYGYRTVLQRGNRLLKASKKGIDTIKVLRFDHGKKRIQIDTG